MSDKSKKIIKGLAEAVEVLPDDKREYLLGFADGVAAMAGKKPGKSEENHETEEADKK